MSSVAPTFESVFTPEYWEPIPEATNRVSLWEILKPYRASRDSLALARESLLLAGSKLIEGEAPQKISAGELVGGPDDTKYALPGAVILLDEEVVDLRPDAEPSIIPHKNIESEAELAQSAITAFLSNRRFTTIPDEANYAVYDNYCGELLDSNGRYTRYVNLYAYYTSRQGITAALGLMQWRNEPGSPKVIAPSGSFRNRPWCNSARVSETINQTKNPEMPRLYRIRSAHLCLRGIAEVAKSKSKAVSATPRLSPASS